MKLEVLGGFILLNVGLRMRRCGLVIVYVNVGFCINNIKYFCFGRV